MAYETWLTTTIQYCLDPISCSNDIYKLLLGLTYIGKDILDHLNLECGEGTAPVFLVGNELLVDSLELNLSSLNLCSLLLEVLHHLDVGLSEHFSFALNHCEVGQQEIEFRF